MSKTAFSLMMLCACLLGCGSGGGGTADEMSNSPATGSDANGGDGANDGDGADASNGGDGNTPGADGADSSDGDGSEGADGTPSDGSAGGDDVDAGGSVGSDGDDPGAAAGVVSCGDTACTTPQICCVSFFGGSNGGFECTEQSACSGPVSAPGTCDGKEDCGSGEACCAKFALTGGSGAFCQPGCEGDSQALCHGDSDCGDGQKCIACAPPTGGIVDLVYHLCSASDQCPSPYMNVM